MRNKAVYSRRVGAALNGLGDFTLEDWTDFGGSPSPISTQNSLPAPDANIIKGFLDFGAKLIGSQQAPQQPQYATTQYRAPQPNPMMVPLLVAAGLAAVFILTRK